MERCGMGIQNMITTIFFKNDLKPFLKSVYNSREHENSKHDKSLLRQMEFQFLAAFQFKFEERYNL